MTNTMRIIILIVILPVLILGLIVSCGEFSLYQLSGVMPPGMEEAELPLEPTIYYVEGQQLWRGRLPDSFGMQVEATEQFFSSPTLQDTTDLAVDPATKCIYWQHNDIIYRVRADGRGWEVSAVPPQGAEIVSFALDPVNSTLYFSKADTPTIYWADAGENSAVNIVPIPEGGAFAPQAPEDLAFDPQNAANGGLFWADNFNDPLIGGYNMDANDAYPVMAPDAASSDVVKIACYEPASTLYYYLADNTLHSNTYDGSTHSQLSNALTALPSDMVIDEESEMFYFAGGSDVWQMPLGGSSAPLSIRHEPNGVTAVAVYRP